MPAEMLASMIYLEEPEYPEYAMHMLYVDYSGTPNYGNMFGNSLPVGPPTNNRQIPKLFGLSTMKEYVAHMSLHNVFPGILQELVPNGMVSVLALSRQEDTDVEMEAIVGVNHRLGFFALCTSMSC